MEYPNELLKLAILLSAIGSINWAFTSVGKNWFAIFFGNKGSGRFMEKVYTNKAYYKLTALERATMIVVGIAGWLSLYFLFTQL
jgi:uncharacterized membrane protein YuzA (DUF378 family)